MTEDKKELRISELLFHLKMTSRGLFDLETGLRNSAENSVPYNHIKDAVLELKELREKAEAFAFGIRNAAETCIALEGRSKALHASIITLAKSYEAQGRVAEARAVRGLVE